MEGVVLIIVVAPQAVLCYESRLKGECNMRPSMPKIGWSLVSVSVIALLSVNILIGVGDWLGIGKRGQSGILLKTIAPSAVATGGNTHCVTCVRVLDLWECEPAPSGGLTCYSGDGQMCSMYGVCPGGE